MMKKRVEVTSDNVSLANSGEPGASYMSEHLHSLGTS
jgi:hypothetical protein